MNAQELLDFYERMQREYAEASAMRHIEWDDWELAYSLGFKFGASSLPQATPQKIATVLINCCQILDIVKQEWATDNCWSEWDQSVRDSASELLRKIEGRTA